MAAIVELSGSDLAALLCSRVCHDLISPVGAINNGLEVLAEDSGQDMKEFANELIAKSARQASAKLMFCRIAFGAAGSAGVEIDTGDAEAVARGFMESEKAELDWTMPRILLAKNRVKLVLNMLMIAVGAVPRGGTVKVEMTDDGEKQTFVLRSSGKKARIPNHAADLLAGKGEDGRIDAHAIQPFYTGLLAREEGLSVTIEMDGDDVVMTAE